MKRLLRLPTRLSLIAIFVGGAVAAPVKDASSKTQSTVGTHGELRILPSQTDPAIKEFNTAHCVYPSRAPVERHELLLWLPGTQPSGTVSDGPGGGGRFCEIAAELGYRAIVLKYPNDEPAAECRRDHDPRAFEDFRMAIIAGGRTHYNIVSRTDSIENRLIKLLRYLQQTRADEKWDQFLTEEGGIQWSAIAVAGLSQGGGHAALLGIKHRVARVICFGAPKDYSIALGQPAAWLTAKSETPKDHFFAFNHLQDHQGCTPQQQAENLLALKLHVFGKTADVDSEPFPYHHTRILMTNFQGKSLDSKTAHTSVVSPRNEGIFGKVWRYMLTDTSS